jgi:hypothetical protein
LLEIAIEVASSSRKTVSMRRGCATGCGDVAAMSVPVLLKISLLGRCSALGEGALRVAPLSTRRGRLC